MTAWRARRWVSVASWSRPPVSALSHRATSPESGEKVELFKAFTPDNDPHQEHDFGSIEHEGNRVFWKIDYYAKDMESGSEHPEDPGQTVRVLTIMLAEEY